MKIVVILEDNDMIKNAVHKLMELIHAPVAPKVYITSKDEVLNDFTSLEEFVESLEPPAKRLQN